VKYVPPWSINPGSCFVFQMRRCQEGEGGDLVIHMSGQFRVVSLNIRQLFSLFFHEGGTFFSLVVRLGFRVYFKWVVPKTVFSILEVKISKSAPSS
jgi:hypothetical protein